MGIFALCALAAGVFAGCNSSEKIAAKFWLTWQKRATKSGGSPAGAVLFDIVDKRKGCAGGGAVSVLFCSCIAKEDDYLSIPNTMRRT
jgi:hypothetical protein